MVTMNDCDYRLEYRMVPRVRQRLMDSLLQPLVNASIFT